jgi:hypothetical protein
MRNIAINLKSIQHVEDDENNCHFFRVSSISNLDELIQNLTGVSGFNLIVEDMLMGRFIDNDSENLLDNKINVFMLVKQVSIADASDLETVIKESEGECMKIFSKMRKDYHNDHKPIFPKTGLRNMDWNSITYQTVGPLGDNFYGLMYSFNITPPLAEKLVYNENDWL